MTTPTMFEGKTFNILVGFPPGRPHDLEAHVFARHLRKYLPGHPRVLVQNMPAREAWDVLPSLQPRQAGRSGGGHFPPGAFIRQIVQQDGEARGHAWKNRLINPRLCLCQF